jgi:hypothetical protein
MKQWLFNIICGLVLCLFLYTAVSKINGFENFKGVLRISPLVGNKNVIAAYGIVLSEIVVSVLLFIATTRRAGLIAALALLIVFTFYIGYMLAFAPQLPCACGGVISSLGWKQHLLFNLFFIAIMLWTLRTKAKPYKNSLSR